MNKNSKIFLSLQIVILSSIAGMSVLQMVLTNDLVTYGSEVTSSEKKSQWLQSENNILTQQVAAAKSLAALETKAKAQGFVKPTTSIVLTNELPVALR